MNAGGIMQASGPELSLESTSSFFFISLAPKPRVLAEAGARDKEHDRPLKTPALVAVCSFVGGSWHLDRVRHLLSPVRSGAVLFEDRWLCCVSIGAKNFYFFTFSHVSLLFAKFTKKMHLLWATLHKI
ncbi:MAG: hypothetical protein O7D30_12560 [Rickettsia endosymbiont of Ixodes persulcatus]|nr:hypothetical protein [Rickettsia endosymbiont of Ixodes persulcatus]